MLTGIKNRNVIKTVTLILTLYSLPALASNDVSNFARKMASIQAGAQENEAATVTGEEGVKYNKGDCIVATNINESWHGEYAWILGFGDIAGFPGENYLLLFPSYHSKDIVFGKEIETKTQLVHGSLCEKSYNDAVRARRANGN